MELNQLDFDRLGDYDEDSNAKCSEQDFVKRLLPHLIPSEIPDARPRDMSIFVAVAGHPNRAIDVVDNSGTVLFTVPPILARAPTPEPSKEMDPANDLGELSAEYDGRIGNEPPHVVNQWYYNALLSRNLSPEASLTQLYAQMWVTIYRRYNIPLSRLFGDKAEAIEKAVPVAAPAKEKLPQGSIENHATDDEDFEAM